MAEATKTTRPAARKPQDRKPKATDAVVVDGITLTSTREALVARMQDWDAVECISTLSDPEASGAARLVAAPKVLRLIFADDYATVKQELREKHGGELNEAIMTDFLKSAMEAFAPNS